MKILIKGDEGTIKKATGRSKTFKCMTCGCVFEAEEGEYEESERYWEITSSKCPQCGGFSKVHILAPNELELIKAGEK